MNKWRSWDELTCGRVWSRNWAVNTVSGRKMKLRRRYGGVRNSDTWWWQWAQGGDAQKHNLCHCFFSLHCACFCCGSCSSFHFISIWSTLSSLHLLIGYVMWFEKLMVTQLNFLVKKKKNWILFYKILR
jgi:hypothetical protein